MNLCAKCGTSPRADRTYCRPCRKVVQHAHYESNKAAYAARSKRHRAANPEAHKAAVKRYYSTARGKEKRQQYLLKHVYGLSPEAYRALLDIQEGRCAICEEEPGKRKLHVDHDHVTGRVRGLLCGNCNKALGLVKDAPQRLRAAALYLERAG